MQLFLLLLVGFIQAQLNKISPFENEDLEMDIKEQVKWHGYPIIQYKVETDDGYIITLHRIPGKRNETLSQSLRKMKSEPKQSVLMVHGIFGNAQSWVVNGPGEDGKALPYQIVDTEQYDVWMMNNRGTSYSREHAWLNANSDPEFWNFTFEDYGKDLKASLEFIQEKKKEKTKISLIGFSEGVAASFSAMASDPDYFDIKLNIMVALSPAVFFKHATDGILDRLSWLESLSPTFKDYSYLEVLGVDNPRISMAKDLTENHRAMCWIYSDICKKSNITLSQLVKMGSLNPLYQKRERLDYYMNVSFRGRSGTSLKNLNHLTQMIDRGRFQKFDYERENKRIYGSDHPPEYNLTKIEVPVAILVGKLDKFATVKDAQKIKDQLKNVISFKIMPQTDHLGMIMRQFLPQGRDIISLLSQFKIKRISPSQVKYKFEQYFSYALEQNPNCLLNSCHGDKCCASVDFKSKNNGFEPYRQTYCINQQVLGAGEIIDFGSFRANITCNQNKTWSGTNKITGLGVLSMIAGIVYSF